MAGPQPVEAPAALVTDGEVELPSILTTQASFDEAISFHPVQETRESVSTQLVARDPGGDQGAQRQLAIPSPGRCTSTLNSSSAKSSSARLWAKRLMMRLVAHWRSREAKRRSPSPTGRVTRGRLLSVIGVASGSAARLGVVEGPSWDLRQRLVYDVIT